ncbi:methyltransferase domain-containing protein [Paenibacillus sp. PDC88]|nr:methyltransferase domain-containing protein [Paenibacillus sp. PDC88]SDW33388.1 Methyltransferase domain-containing protein [Paenibacillus sp. PDC88]
MKNSGLDLNRIIFIGRSYEEYEHMFQISNDDIASKRILDCPGGACSFTAVANQRGGKAKSVDIAYAYSWDILYAKGKEDIKHAMEQMSKAQDQYKWNYFSNLADLLDHRTHALGLSTTDRRANPENYIEAALPQLPFQDKQFDLILSAHFLFMYGERLSLQFHLDTLQEMMRVAEEEIRIYPIIQLDGRRYPLLDEVLSYVDREGWTSELVNVSYEFQRGANQMLKLSR